MTDRVSGVTPSPGTSGFRLDGIDIGCMADLGLLGHEVNNSPSFQEEPEVSQSPALPVKGALVLVAVSG